MKLLCAFAVIASVCVVVVKKMCRRVKLVPENFDLQLIFWREDPNLPPKEYKLVAVACRLTSPPYVSARTIYQADDETKEQTPEAARVMKEDFYMGEGATGAETESNAIKLVKEMKNALGQCGFDLRKWKLNGKKLAKELEDESDKDVIFAEKDHTSALGPK